MSYKIRHLNDHQRREVARDYCPTHYFKGDKEIQLEIEEKVEIQNILRGCLLALAFDDNRYDNPSQVAYMAECIGMYNGILEEHNLYDIVFCPCMRMLREIHVD